MSGPRAEQDFLSQCRMEYIKLAYELDHNGLNLQSIQKTCSFLTDIKPNHSLLRGIAYQPTGLALGRPLPESSQVELFARLACLAEAQLKQYFGPGQPSFAYVPADWYHITIANRTHYEFSAISYLNEDEKQAVDALISKLDLQEIRVIASGLILTASGRLLVKCLPTDDRILKLRATLVHNIPWIQINTPKIVYIKLGHLMAPLSTPQLQSFIAWLAKSEQYAICDLVFTDIYTPQGRISL